MSDSSPTMKTVEARPAGDYHVLQHQLASRLPCPYKGLFSEE